jgi:DNA helicase-2/ATP-dependent DNA helicase PcrA
VGFYADLHVHSRYSRATSRNCDLEHLALWARKKGITVVGTGDFTHPAWFAELKDHLVPAEPGLYRLRPDLERIVAGRLPRACHGATRFMLSVEISTIYKKDDATRKVHHLVYAPDFATAERVSRRLGKIGNLASDGRPILGLDSRNVLEITLESSPDTYLVPAHIWTPWFAALGSKSGFDSIDLCYADLSPHIFAVETGLSSDPPMNRRVSSLDRFRLVSNSDAHSPEKLGREACAFTGNLDYFAIRDALETGHGYDGTVEFFPEEGKYHLDGHRACQVRLEPHETRAAGGTCSVCGKPLTVGVMHRIEALSDRGNVASPGTAGRVENLVPLPEVLSELCQVGCKSKRVSRQYEELLGQLGPELPLLTKVPLDDIRRATSSLFAEAVNRLREHRVIREAGYDGAYGTIRLFNDEELRNHPAGQSVFGDKRLHASPSDKPFPGPANIRQSKELPIASTREPVEVHSVRNGKAPDPDADRRRSQVVARQSGGESV